MYGLFVFVLPCTFTFPYLPVDSVVTFWSPEIKVDEEVAFQLSLAAPLNVDLSSLPVSSLTIHFTEDIVPVIVRHVGSGSAAQTVSLVDLGHVSAHEGKTTDAQAHLRWKPGAKIVFAGTMSSDIPTSLKVCSS